MKKTVSTEKIISNIKAKEAGLTVNEISRKYGISNSTFQKWKSKYGIWALVMHPD